MSDFFKSLSEKQLEGTDVIIAEKINPVLGALGVASALAGHQMVKNPNNDLINTVQNIQIQKNNHLGKIVSANVDYKNYAIIYTDEHGNKLIKKGGDINKLANNPGNIALPKKGFGPRNQQVFKDMGAIGWFKGKSNMYAIFPDKETGEKALYNWLFNSHRKDWTVRHMIHVYAPEIENNTKNYLKFINSHGLKSETKLCNLSKSQQNALIEAIKKMEGKREPTEQFIPKEQFDTRLAKNNQKVSVYESKNINTKKAPLYIAKSIDDICLTMKQHKLNSVKVSYDSSIDTYIFGDTYNFVHWSLISCAFRNGLYTKFEFEDDDDLCHKAIDYCCDLDNFAIATTNCAHDLISDHLEPEERINEYGQDFWIYRNHEVETLNEGVIPTYEEDGTRYFYGYYCFTESELLNMLDSKFSRNDVRVAYEFNKHVYMFSDTITTIHYNIVFLAVTETNLFDSIPEIKENKNADEDTVQELIKQHLYIAPFKIYRNDSQDSDEMFLKFLFNTVDNTSDYYDMACKINETKWAVCRSDEFGDVKQVPLFQGKEWITADEYFTKYQNDEDDELNESVQNNKVIAYHGSQTDKLQFMKNHALYLTDNYDLAYEFATKDGDGGLVSGEVATLYTCELNLKKVYETHSEAEYDANFVDVSFNREKWLEKGFNAIIIHPTEASKTTYYIMLNPEEDVKIIDKEIIDYGDLLMEGLVPYSTKIAGLVNRLDDIINQKLKKYNVKTELKSLGHDIKNKSEINSYYILVNIEYPYKNYTIPVSIKCRCSNHIKFDFDKEKDINVFVPNYKVFDNNKYKKDCMEYLLTPDNIELYVNQGFSDIKVQIENQLQKIVKILNKITPDILKDILKLSDKEVITKYDFLYPIYFKSWFRKYINSLKSENLHN